MIRLQPRSTRTDTLFPYTTLFRSGSCSFSFWGAEPPLLTDKTALSGGESARFAACRGGRAAYICREPMVMNSHRRGSAGRSEEHTSELQSLMRSSYAVFCLKKKTK